MIIGAITLAVAAIPKELWIVIGISAAAASAFWIFGKSKNCSAPDSQGQSTRSNDSTLRFGDASRQPPAHQWGSNPSSLDSSEQANNHCRHNDLGQHAVRRL